MRSGSWQCSDDGMYREEGGEEHERQHWACADGGAAHSTTLPPLNYRTDIQQSCIGSADPEINAHAYDSWNVSWGFKSRHPGGALFLFADSSVHFVSEDINYVLYQYLGCRDDGTHIEEIP